MLNAANGEALRKMGNTVPSLLQEGVETTEKDSLKSQPSRVRQKIGSCWKCKALSHNY